MGPVGRISNTDRIKRELVAEGSIFQSSSDTELMLHLIARSRATDFHTALCETLASLEGAYSLAMIHDEELIAVGKPVVWACRLSSVEGGRTVLNQQAAVDVLRRYPNAIESKDCQVVLKHEGQCLGKEVRLTVREIPIADADWPDGR